MSAISIKNIEDALFNWVDSLNIVPSNKIVFEEQNVKRPIPPYISMKLITLPQKLGSRDNIKHDVDDNYKIHGVRSLTVSCKSYGNTAIQLMSDMHESFELSSVRDIFLNANLAIWDEGSPTDISTVLETGFETRANMDIIVAGTSEQIDTRGYIATASYEGTINKEDGTPKVVTGDIP